MEQISFKKYGEEHFSKTIDWLTDPYIRSSFGITYEVNLEGHVSWLERNPNSELLALYVGENYVGNIVLTHLKRHFSTYFQIYIGDPNQRGKGLGTKFMHLSLKYCFEVLGQNRVWLHVEPTNTVAMSLYEKVGFQHEGIERQSVFSNNKFLDQYRMALVRSDYVGIK